MNEKQRKKFEVINKIVNDLISKKEAEIELNLTRRQINRLIIKHNNEGKDGFVHKNNGNQNAKTINDNIKEEIINKYLNEYYDYNFTHFYEMAINNKYDISFPELNIILAEADIISPQAQHKTRNEYNKKMKELTKKKVISEEQKELFETRQIQEEQAHVRRSNLHLKFGEELQIDASEYIWFGNIKTQLHLVVDKATKIILFGWLIMKKQ